MTTAEAAGAPAIGATGARPPFDAVTIAAHWTTVVLVAGLFGVAFMIGQARDAATAKVLLTVHRSLGVTVWSLTALRLGWRLTGATVPPLPGAMPAIQRLAARLNQWGLYALLLLQPVTGLAQSLFRGRAFDLFIWLVPVLTPRDKALVHLFNQVHEWGAWALAGLIALHAAAGLIHALVLRDGVFDSIWPRRRADKASR